MPPKKATGGKVTGKRTIAERLESLRSNPFEKRSNLKQKHNVIGRRVKGQNRDVAAARLRAVEKRKKTLLLEYNSRGKTNSFKDRRFGEKDDGSMSMEDKLFARFQAERKKRVRNSSLFNLSEEPAPEDVLTHGGKVIDDFQDVDVERHSSDEEDDHEANATITERLHFGGGEGGDGEKEERDNRSHKEIMAEVIAKSKLHKQERQRLKEEREDLTEALDSEFSSLQGLLSFRPKKNERQEEREAPDHYDKITRELAFEAKAKATSRTLTPEEQAQKEKEKLEELEKKRLRRMQGLPSDSEDETEKGKKKRRGPATDDDLNDDYTIDPANEDEEEEGDLLSSDDEGEEEEDSEEEEEEETEKPSKRLKPSADSDEAEEEEGEEEDTDEGSDLENDDEVELSPSEKKKQGAEEKDDGEGADMDNEKAKQRQAAKEEIPYIFPCPSSLSELLALLANYAKKPADDLLIVSRILKCHSIHLGGENKKKLTAFFGVMLQFFLHLADNDHETEERKEEISELSKVLWQVAQELPEVAGKGFRSQLEAIRLEFYKRKMDKRQGATVSSAWPSLSSLLFFRLLPNIFPSSDFKHSVVSPAELLICQMLVQNPVCGARDIAHGLYLCAMLLHYTAENKRYVPEVLHFFLVALGYLLAIPQTAALSGSLAGDKKERKSRKQILQAWRGEGKPLLVWSLPDIRDGEEELGAVLWSMARLVGAACFQWSALPAAPEIFRPLRAMLGKLLTELQDASPELRQALQQCFEALDATVTEHEQGRAPLQLQKVKPVAIPTLDPKFEETYTFKKDMDPNKERAKAKQLERQVKREKKGAVRELKRDAAFLAKAKLEDERKATQAKKEKQKEIWSWLQDQQATVNQQVKKGGGLLTGGGSGIKKRPRVNRG